MVFSAMSVVINFGLVIFPFICLLTLFHRELYSVHKQCQGFFSGGDDESRFKLRFLILVEE